MRTRFTILVAFAMVVGLVVTGPVASARHWDGYSPILPFGSQHHAGEIIAASVGETLEFGSRWGTCTRGLAQAYASNAEVSVWVDEVEWDDEVELPAAGWSRPINPDDQITEFSFEDQCTSNAYADTGWWVFWSAPFTFTEPGLYTVTVEVTHTEDIHDGAGSYVEAGQQFWGEVFILVQDGYPLVLPPSPRFDEAGVAEKGQVLADALSLATGEDFFVVVADSQRHVYELMCAMPGTAVGFVPTLAYAFAHPDCGVDVSFKAVRFGWDSGWTQFLVPRGSDIDEIGDLEGPSWAYPDFGPDSGPSLSGYLVPLGMMRMAGVTPGGGLPADGHHGAVRAVYTNPAAFGTTFFSPPRFPGGEWQPGDAPDIPDEVVESCGWDGIGKLVCDHGWRVFDARRMNELFDLKSMVQTVRILAISPPYPNDAVAFGAEFPTDVRTGIEVALSALVGEDAWNESVNPLYLWQDMSVATDADWVWFRTVLEAAEFGADDL